MRRSKSLTVVAFVLVSLLVGSLTDSADACRLFQRLRARRQASQAQRHTSHCMWPKNLDFPPKPETSVPPLCGQNLPVVLIPEELPAPEPVATPAPPPPSQCQCVGLGVSWDELEPSPGLYDFQAFDKFMTDLQPSVERWRKTGVFESRYHGKPLQLTVLAGKDCPKWLCKLVKHSFPVQSARTGKELGKFPDASDKHYQTARKQLEQRLKKKYGDWCHIQFEFHVNDREHPDE